MERSIGTIAKDLAAGRLVPFLGPGLLGMQGQAPVPDSPQALAATFAAKVSLPRRARGNLWASAQSIETMRHRRTVEAFMREAFSAPPSPGPLHRLFARLCPPLIVSAWYDRALEAALGDSSSWGLVAGTSKHAIGRSGWWKTRDAAGRPVPDAEAHRWSTVVYKPHGCIEPDADMLVSDSDYVEVLTEIDIQTPIPPVVQDLRRDRGFLFLGCRFDDQLLRTFARQVLKRAGAARYAVLPDTLTRSETRFLDEQGITRIDRPLASVATALAGELA